MISASVVALVLAATALALAIIAIILHVRLVLAQRRHERDAALVWRQRQAAIDARAAQLFGEDSRC
jgi:hypothetical protein